MFAPGTNGGLCLPQYYACFVVVALLGWGHAQQMEVVDAGSDPMNLSPSFTRRERPNFLYMLSDDLGYGEISIMPGRSNFNITTPNIDRFFLEGMRFTDFYANAECAVSRGAIMTGKHSGHATVRSNVNQPSLREKDVTFLMALQEHGGYKTSCVGKWHLSGNKQFVPLRGNPEGAPWNKGCDRFFGSEYWAWYYPVEKVYRYNEEDGLRELTYPNNMNATREKCMADGNQCVWLTDMNLEEVLGELEYHKKRQDAEAAEGLIPTPFFIYLAWTDPHTGWWEYTPSRNNGYLPGPVGQPVPSDKEWARYTNWPDYEQDHAAAVVSYHDWYTQIVLDKLDSLGLRDNTVVIYSSDNGASSANGDAQKIPKGYFFDASGPLQGYKHWLTEGGTRVPAAIRWPGKIAPGTVSNQPLAVWDLFPTFLEMADIDRVHWPLDLDGVSFWQGVLQQRPAVWGSDNVVPALDFYHPPLYWERCAVEGAVLTRPAWTLSRPGASYQRAIRLGRWKGYQIFMEGEFSEFRVFDLETDIGEERDISDSNAAVAKQLWDLMNSPGMRTNSAGGYNYAQGDDCDLYYGKPL